VPVLRKIAIDVIEAWGHINVRATHKTTFEITKEKELTPRGDCIIGVKATKGASELSNELKDIIKNNEAVLVIALFTENHKDIVIARGSYRLTLGDQTKIIVRKSSYVNDATIGIYSNKAAVDIDRELIDDLRKGAKLTVLLIGVLP
jgi:hypothetical protein